ncbi:uncharacterized protein LOC132759031 [Ruditapes philippinarum]|uniref:uncharacterized protein LOC132759031 n=1 Tax=Ruditapes philippinarum TaxID=129788 RepID=UPI00295C031B|nr:uncharacterized protein LOC132759031 [Ruditapes philippinarum]
MEDKGTADKSVYPPLTAEQNPEETHEMVTNENQEVPAADDVKFTPKVNQAGALPSVRRVNILLWSNFVGVLLLLVGFVAPGWLTVTAEHKLTYIPSSWSGRTQHIQDVYQDYALWYVIQCYPHDGKSIECETMTYRSISGIYADEVTSYEKLAIAKLENEGGDKFMFHGVALIFGFSKFVQIQTLYTMALLISFALLYVWYDLRKKVVRGTSNGPSKWMWIFLILLTILAIVLIFIGVFIFVGVRGNLGYELGTAFGLLFAVFGGCFLGVVFVTELVQVLCCSNFGA